MGEPQAKVHGYVTRHHLSFPHLLDADHKLSALFGVRATPTNFLVNREGHMLGGGMGYRDWTTPEAHRLIQSLLSAEKDHQ